VQTRELRLALVCFGGVSLAVYMHGITKEVWKLCRASMRAHHPDPGSLAPAADSEIVYLELLRALQRPDLTGLDLRVIVDIVAGASAGGINGIQLARALVEGHDLDAVTPLWLDQADSDVLLDARAASRPLSKLWAIPLVWWVRRRGLGVEDKAEMAAHGEVRRKLSRFMRSRWFAPPFSGATFTRLLHDGFEAMAAGVRTPPLVPRLHPFDLFVTVTDYQGRLEQLRLNSPPLVLEPEHRLTIGFTCPGDGAERHVGDTPSLTLAARATASFPGAFPPARVAEVDALLAGKGLTWPGRADFLARNFPGRSQPEQVTLLDGAILDNRPFGPAIAALARRPAHREVDRRFVYIDPKPGMHEQGIAEPAAEPGWFAAILRSLADIPRQQPIKDNLAQIEALSVKVRRLRHILLGMLPEVDAAIDAAIGMKMLWLAPTPERLADWRSRLQGEAARRAGYAHAAYGRLKFSGVADGLATLLADLGGADVADVRRSLWRFLRQHGINVPEQALAREGAQSPYVMFLRRFDLDFRIRRLRFLIRRINLAAEAATNDTDRDALAAAKAGLYTILGPHLECRNRARLAGAVAAAADAVVHPGAALDALAASLDLKGLDDASDAALVQLLGPAMPRRLRRMLLAAYLGFPFFDIAVLPLIADGGVDELDEIKVDRISPADCSALTRAGGQQLKGALFNAFGAFFSRAWRQHDYLWGRLHGAERMIELIMSALPAAARPPEDVLAKARRGAFRAIVAAERGRLGDVPELLAALDATLLERPPGSPGDTGADNG
jgi:patatin-related protein